MNTEKKEEYVQPVLVMHELLRDITAKASGSGLRTLGFVHSHHHHHDR
jgi:hypothetical protein